MTLTIGNALSGTYAIDRSVLTDVTSAIGVGLWHARRRSGSGAVSETLYFTDDTLVVWRISRSSSLWSSMPRPAP